MSNITDTALRRAMQVLREVLEQSNGGSGGGDGDKHTAWPASTSIKDNWDKIQLLDVYLSQVCIKKEPYKVGAQIWFAGAGTYRKFTVTDSGEVSTQFVDHEPKKWTAGPFTGIKAGDFVNDMPVIFVRDGYFFYWNGSGFTSCKISAGNVASFDSYFFPKDWTEEDMINDPMVALLTVKVGDRIEGRPVVQISQDGHGSIIKYRAVCSAGLDGWVYYEFDQMDNFVRVTLKQNVTGTPSSTILKSA